MAIVVGTLTLAPPVGRLPRFLNPRFATSLSPIKRGSDGKWARKCEVNSSSGKLEDSELSSGAPTLDRNDGVEMQLQLFQEMSSRGVVFDPNTTSAAMLCFAQNGFFGLAQGMWDEILNSSHVPSADFISRLMNAYGRAGRFDEVLRVLRDVTSRDFGFHHEVYTSAVACFGKAGQLELMESTMREMVSKGFKVDSLMGNAIVKHYSIFGTLEEMEVAYQRLKKSRILIEEEGIRAVALAYIRKEKFYKLGEFLRDAGLGRRNVGNLLWNLLLLSYAANFKMKSLQREFLRMVEAGFSPDLTTFNIRALAFSRMSMFWDLHLSIEHMRHKGVVHDLVTYGCIVDAYLDRRFGRNIFFALNNMNLNSVPQVSTDPIVFEVFGKGDFHSFAEVLLESKRRRGWTYLKLIKMYLKRKHRSNQIFWNY